VPAVDVLLPLRDGAATLAEALESVRAQTLRDFRCLVLDDGSRDAGPDLVRRTAAEDGRFVLCPLPPRGIAPTLNDGLARAEAALVARLDADDRMHPERLERQVAYLRTHPDVDVVSSRVVFFGDGVSDRLRAYETWLNGTCTHDAIVRDLFVESPLPHPSVAVRTASLRAVGGYRAGAFPEDYDLWLRGLRAGWRFAKLPGTLTSIRDHAARLTKTDPRYTPRAFLECKAEHLVEMRGLAGRDVVVWGAGRDGKRAAKALRRRGAVLRRFVDIAPTKLGRRTMGAWVTPPESLRESPRAFVVAAVGVRGARGEIRAALAELGYREGPDFVCFG
jgi:glycosyltransferase involved in cell wall biosynthesis